MTAPVDRVIARWAGRLAAEPSTVAVILKGSHVTGSAGPHSDIDFDVLVGPDGPSDYLAFLEEAGAGRLRHISVAREPLDAWLASADEPVDWSLGLPAREPTRLMWAARDDLWQRLDRPWLAHPPGEPELEDAIEGLGKVRNARSRGDDLDLRLAAQTLARLVPGILRPLNPEVHATSPRHALDLALGFPVAPPGYRADLLACLGLAPAPTEDLHAAAARLLVGTLELAAQRADVIAPLVPPDLAGALADGTLLRYARQIADTP